MKTQSALPAVDLACDLLKALACPNRLRILCRLTEGEKSVGEMAALIGLRETGVSQHLALLRRDRVVRCRREGQTVFYALDHSGAERLLRVLHELFCSQSTAVATGLPAAGAKGRFASSSNR